MSSVDISSNTNGLYIDLSDNHIKYTSNNLIYSSLEKDRLEINTSNLSDGLYQICFYTSGNKFGIFSLFKYSGELYWDVIKSNVNRHGRNGYIIDVVFNNSAKNEKIISINIIKLA